MGMLRFFVVTFLAISISACIQDRPSAQKAEAQYRVSELPNALNLDRFQVEGFENIGTESDPVWVSRITANVSTQQDTYEIHSVLEGNRILEKVYSAGESFQLSGRVGTRSDGDGGWQYEFQVNNAPIRDMGRPFSEYGRDAIRIDTSEAQALIEAEEERQRKEAIEREERMAVQRAERERRLAEEREKRQRVEAAVEEFGALSVPDGGIRDFVGNRCSDEGDEYNILVTGRANGNSVWGSNPYSLRSDVAKSVVHSGALADGQQGIVTVTIVQEDMYPGSPRNGVDSEGYSPRYQCRYKLGYSISPLMVIE